MNHAHNNPSTVAQSAAKSHVGAAASIPLPRRVPLLSSIEALYDSGSAENQKCRYRRLLKGFSEHFPDHGDTDRPLFFSAPGRTELCGNHTDHNNGKVLAAAISLDTIAAAAPRHDSLVRIVSEGFGAFDVDLADLSARPRERGSSAAIVRGMAAGLTSLAARRNGAAATAGDASSATATISGFDAFVQSDVLPGSGLSSSAAFEVLMGAIFAVFSRIDASPAKIASIGQFAENVYFGKPCGLMDQMASALGSITAIDFHDPAKAAVELLSFDPGEYGLSIVIVATGGSHADLTDDYAAIPAEMKAVAALLGRLTLVETTAAELVEKAADIRVACGDRAFLRAWHFVHETERPAALKEAIRDGEIARYLSTVRASGESSARFLQNLYPPKSPSEQGIPLALALTEDFLAGAGACRVHGGGFAGTIQAYVPIARLEAYRALMEAVFGAGVVFPLRIRPYGVVCIENQKGAFDER